MFSEHITTLDYFAGLAMQALLRTADDAVWKGRTDCYELRKIAEESYEVAWAMIEEAESRIKK